MDEATAEPVTYGAARTGAGLTRALAARLAGLAFADLRAETLAAVRRGVLDWMGCAVAGSRHPATGLLVETLAVVSGGRSATVIGRGLRLAPLEAALANGQMGHVLDYDDTHLGGVVLHASSAILPALIALAEQRPLDGRTFAAAYVAGFEAGVRAGQAAPDHHAGGWHLTGTLGSIAAGTAVARALGLDAEGTTWAMAVAATQAGGMQQNRGTMSKSLHAGKAAQNGLLAGLLAEAGFDGSDEILEGRRGFCRIYSARTDEEALVRGLGERWQIEDNGHKPHACGVVLHPAIDAMIALGRAAEGAAPETVRLRVNPAAVTITGVVAPETGLKSKFSLTHTAAVAFLDLAAGVAQFADARAGAEDVRRLAARVTVETDAGLARDQAEAEVRLADGRVLAHRVDHAAGTVANPMDDGALSAKFRANAVPVLGATLAGEIEAAAWSVEDLADVGLLVRLAG